MTDSNEMREMPLGDINSLDEVVRELEIQDSFTTPAEAVRKLKWCNDNQAKTIRALHDREERLAELLAEAELSRDGWIDINAEAGKALKRLNDRVGELTKAVCRITSKADSVIRTDAGGNQHRLVFHKDLEALAALVKDLP